MTRLLMSLLLALGLASSLAACGKRGPLEAPPGSEYPHKYPHE